MVRNSRKPSPALSQKKHRAIRAASTDILLAHGYASATMDMIAEEAGVSKQTVYNHFANKEELFKEIVEDLTSKLMEPVVLRDAETSTPRQVLHALGHDLLSLMLEPSSLGLHRLIVAEAGRFPELGSAIYKVGAGRVLSELSAYLAAETANGKLSVPDPDFAAEQFIGMVTGWVQLRALLGVDTDDEESALATRAERTVAAFLSLYGPKQA